MSSTENLLTLPTNVVDMVNDILATIDIDDMKTNQYNENNDGNNNNNNNNNNNSNSNIDNKNHDDKADEVGLSLEFGNLEDEENTSATNMRSEIADDNSNNRNNNIYVENNDNCSDTLQNYEINNESDDDDIGCSIGKSLHDDSKPSRTIEQWLSQANHVVHPVWIGNLPHGTNVNELRRYVENAVGKVLISVHITVKQAEKSKSSTAERGYAFINMPTAEKQTLCITLLDNKPFKGEKLLVRPKRPTRFPSHTYIGNTPISSQFKHFRDKIVPEIMNNPTTNLNIQSVRKILINNQIGLEHLPNRVWCVQCTLIPKCHRQYCAFYHNQNEKELGRILAILTAQNCANHADNNGNSIVNENNIIETSPFSINDDIIVNNDIQNANNIGKNSGNSENSNIVLSNSHNEKHNYINVSQNRMPHLNKSLQK